MVREMKLVDIMKDIDLNTNESKFQKAIAGWLQDVENAHHNHEISSPATESSSATASTSSNVLKEENFFQVKVAERLISSQGYRSVCTGEVYHVDSGSESSVNKQKRKERQNDLFSSLRVTKEPLRCQWLSSKRSKRCGRFFNTAEVLTRHVLEEHIKEAPQHADHNNEKACNWSICKAKVFDLEKHVMEEHLAVHIFACPFEKCKSIEGPTKSLRTLQEHVKKYHSNKDKKRVVFMPMNAASNQPREMEELPKPFASYMIDRPDVRSTRRKSARIFDNHQIALAQLTPSFSQETKRTNAQPWLDKKYDRIQNGTILTDAYALDDGRNIGIHDTWEIPLDCVVPQKSSTSSNGRPKKQIKQEFSAARS